MRVVLKMANETITRTFTDPMSLKMFLTAREGEAYEIIEEVEVT